MAKLRNRVDRSKLHGALANQTGTLQAAEALETSASAVPPSIAPTLESAPALDAPYTALEPAPAVAPHFAPETTPAPLPVASTMPAPAAHRPVKRTTRAATTALEDSTVETKGNRFPTRVDEQYYLPLQQVRTVLRENGIKVSVMGLIDHALAYYLPLVQEKGELLLPRKK